MRRYSSRRHGFVYYCKCLLILAVIAASAICAPDVWLYFHQINDDKILADSVLKNKTFSTPVQEVKAAGLSAYLLEEHSVPIVSISFEFTNAGNAHEDDEKQGSVQLLTALLRDGAGEYDAENFKDTCKEYGIKIGFYENADEFSGYLHTPRQSLDMALKMINLVMQRPRFDKEFLELRKQQLKTAVKMSREKPQAILADEFAEFIFAGHPYARSEITKLETLDNIEAADLRDFMKTHLSRENLIVGFAGDLSVKEAEDILKNVFAKLPEKYEGEKMPELSLELGGREHNIKHESAQAMSIFAVNGTRRNAVDFYPLYLANYIFGGSGLNSRISQIIREKEGLTYGISTYMVERNAVAMLQGSYSSTPDNFHKAQKLLLDEWLKMAKEGVSESELRQAKNALISSFNLRFASIGGIAEMLVGMQEHNLGRDFLEKRNDYIKAVTVQEVNAAAKKYFTVTPDFVNIGIEKEEKKNVRK